LKDPTTKRRKERYGHSGGVKGELGRAFDGRVKVPEISNSGEVWGKDVKRRREVSPRRQKRNILPKKNKKKEKISTRNGSGLKQKERERTEISSALRKKREHFV